MLPLFKKCTSRSKIVNISSILGSIGEIIGDANMYAYRASKVSYIL